MHEAVAREAGGDVEARRARAHGASGGGTRRSPAGGPNSRGGSAGPCSTAPVAVRFGIAKRCAAPPLRVYGRKWNPDSSSMTSGIFASCGNGPIASMIVRRPDRYGHARARRERGGPRAGREEDAIGADLSVARARTRDATVLGKQGVDANALDEPYALERGGRGEPRERVHRRAVAVACAKPAALQIVGADAGYEPGDPFAPDHLDLDAELPVERQRIAERRQALVGLGEEERCRHADDAAPDDERRRAVRDRQSGSSVYLSLPSTSLSVPKRGRSWVKPTIHCSSTARARIVRFASSVSSG